MKFLPSLASATILLGAAPVLHAGDQAQFDSQVRPLLQKRCTECHGAKKQKGELRLDAKTFAFKGGHDGPAILAGKASESPLFQRITSKDADTRMPPEGEPLSEPEIAAVKAWIESGAVWPENDTDRAAAADQRVRHWSVQPLRTFESEGSRLRISRPAANGLPAELKSVELPPESPNPLDAMVRSALREKRLSPSPEADRRTLIRRLSFALHGLPPAPDRVERFCADTHPLAYERLVEEMLASPHFGERWARHWLDIAHYADTHGFERDQLRPNAWRYRDYVIDSLNSDKPYDLFLREQVAGDTFAPANPEAVVATGFLAAGPWDFVGQVEARSDMLRRAARAGDLDDMVTQVITATMGITINCARCHDHKLDPITQREYYSLCSVFAGVKRGERVVDENAAKQLAKEKTRLTNAIAHTRAQISKLAGEGFELAKLLPEGSGIDLANGAVTKARQGYHRDIQSNRLQKVGDVPGVLWVFIPDGKGTVKVTDKHEVKGVPATSGHFWDTIANRPLNAQRNTKLGETDFASKPHSLLAMHANSGITFDLAVLREKAGLGPARFGGILGFGADQSAAATRADFTVFVDGELKFQKLKLRKDETATLDVDIPATAKTLTLVATDGGDGIGSDLLFIGDAKLLPEVSSTTLNEADAATLAGLRAELKTLEQALKTVPEPEKVYAVLPTGETPVVKIHRRGNPEEEGAEVTPAAFAWSTHAPNAFGNRDMPEAERRRALADWLVHPANPLTARVLVNRLWHHHFGQGIVSTPSDFGLGGARPSHPELLDWLATELVRSGWSVKHVHKLILLSACYRQSSNHANPGAAAVDAQNQLLWRQNPRRLDAESLRDAVLFVSGKLNPERGGPGFRDFKYTEAYAPIYEYVTPDSPALWRRSIYRFVVRTTPHQLMTTLDCPDPANMTPARTQTTTALQALALSNNAFILRMAEAMAARIEGETGPVEERIRRAFALALQRAASPAETGAAATLVREHGLFALCRTLLNANEFVYLD
jgi:mono/diheme cytochrome c family protein